MNRHLASMQNTKLCINTGSPGQLRSVQVSHTTCETFWPVVYINSSGHDSCICVGLPYPGNLLPGYPSGNTRLRLSMVLRLRQHNIGYTADGFYRSDDPTNCQSTEGGWLVIHTDLSLSRLTSPC